MTPLLIVLTATVILETYVIIKTNKMDIFNLSHKIDMIRKTNNENSQIVKDTIKNYSNTIKIFIDCNEKKDNAILTIAHAYSRLCQILVGKNNCIIKLLELWGNTDKKVIKELEDENQFFLETKETINVAIDGLKTQKTYDNS